MPNTTNAMTDALQLIQSHTITAFFHQTLQPENGFSLELFRGGSYVGSLHPNQAQTLTARKGDTLYRVNLGPHKQLLTGDLHARGGYTRAYSVQIALQIVDPALFLELYRQGRDPIQIALQDIHAALQEYADRTTYEHMHPANIEAKATYAFSKEPGNLKAGLKITGAYEPTLGEDPAYQQVNESPVITVSGKLTTTEGYVRDYTLIVELAVVDFQFYREVEHAGVSPLERIKDTIDNELQSKAHQQFYEDFTDAYVRDIAEHALDNRTSKFTGGIKIIRVHHLSLGVDATYQPIDISPIVSCNGQITTREGYVRSYDLSVELRVTNYQLYRYLKHTATGTSPLERARIAIDSTFQHYARQQFYEDLSDPQVRSIVERSFDKLESHLTECLAIVRVHRLSLGADTTYRPIDLSPLLRMNGQLTTREKYVRSYDLTVELRVTDRWIYLQLTREGTGPLNLAKVAIDGELQKYARQNFYEDLSEAQLLAVVEHAFDTLENRVTGGLSIVRPHHLSLGADHTYRPLNLSPLLTVTGKLTTLENYVCDYTLIVELLVKNRRKYQELTYEGIDPLARVHTVIDGELQRYARTQSYEALSEPELDQIIEHAFDQLTSRVTDEIEIVRAHQFSLQEPPGYIHLGPRTLTITGTLTTSDLRTRTYEMTVILEVAKPDEFTQLMRQGNDPLDLVKIAIEGAIQHDVEGKKHDEIYEHHLPAAAYATFNSFTESTIAGLTISKAHKAILHVDPKLKDLAEVGHQIDVEKEKMEQTAQLEKRESQLKFEREKQDKQQELILEEIRQQKEKAQYYFDLEKKTTTDANQLRGELFRKLLDQLTERINEDLQSNVSIHEIIDQINILSDHLQSTTLQQSNGTNASRLVSNQQNQNDVLEAGSSEQRSPQISSTSSAPRRNKKSIPRWGIELLEITIPVHLRQFISDQEHAFQIQVLTEEDSPFDDADILVKINHKYVCTLDALETALATIQPTSKVPVVVIRGERLLKLMLDALD